MFDKPQKSVLRGPFRMWPKPLWFIDNKAGATVGRKMTYFNADPSLMRLPGILWAALFG
jgi:aldehyde dehydrogenase (NAD(P)+)